MRTTLEYVDSTMLQDFMDCPRKAFYRYALGWRPEEANHDLVFGSSWHIALEHLLIYGTSPDSIAKAHELFLAEYRKTFSEDTDELHKAKNPNNALLALCDYTTRYNDNNENQVLYTEVAGKVPISEEQDMQFKIDAILRNKAGKIFCLEHKTGSSQSRQWVDQWQLKTQIGTYMHVLHCLAPPEEIEGVIVSGTFFGRSASSTVDFLRLKIKKSLSDMQQWLANVRFWINWFKQEFINLQKVKTTDIVMTAFPMNTESCTKYYGCPYHDLCTSWANPLRQSEKIIPVGFKEEYWDPREFEKTAKYVMHDSKLQERKDEK